MALPTSVVRPRRPDARVLICGHILQNMSCAHTCPLRWQMRIALTGICRCRCINSCQTKRAKILPEEKHDKDANLSLSKTSSLFGSNSATVPHRILKQDVANSRTGAKPMAKVNLSLEIRARTGRGQSALKGLL